MRTYKVGGITIERKRELYPFEVAGIAAGIASHEGARRRDAKDRRETGALRDDYEAWCASAGREPMMAYPAGTPLVIVEIDRSRLEVFAGAPGNPLDKWMTLAKRQKLMI